MIFLTVALNKVWNKPSKYDVICQFLFRDCVKKSDQILSRAGVDFTKVLHTSFVQTHPKSTKRHWWLDCLFALLGSVSVKLLIKH